MTQYGSLDPPNTPVSMTGRFRHRTNVINNEFASSSGWTSSLEIWSGSVTTRSGLWTHRKANSILPKFGPFFTVTSSSSIVDDRRCFFAAFRPSRASLLLLHRFFLLPVPFRLHALGSQGVPDPLDSSLFHLVQVSEVDAALAHEVVPLQIVVLDVDLERDVQSIITREAEGLHPLGVDALLDDAALALLPVQVQERARVARASSTNQVFVHHGQVLAS
mmetsp:Transcript_6468/g.15813  ORF Transcript_6468/g.15813 Transcript_6468/m.15813 type:complete len:219 (+) Transcript_6468:1761-2417(+)